LTTISAISIPYRKNELVTIFLEMQIKAKKSEWESSYLLGEICSNSSCVSSYRGIYFFYVILLNIKNRLKEVGTLF